MKIGLVTTTIHVPHVLRLYRRADPDVKFFIAIDKKTPPLADFAHELGNCQLAGEGGWKCSDLIGWSTIQRRNIATLEALRWGADIIVFVDDDNIPMYPKRYFRDYVRGLTEPFDGLLASPEHEWFDIGQHLDPPVSHRGFPHEFLYLKNRLTHAVDAQIGVLAGLVLGDPDCSAVTRIAKAPHVTGMTAAAVFGIAINPRHTWTVFNSQNSAMVRELVPAFCMLSGVGRHDDIFASLIVQRIARGTGHHVLFGPPMVHQERNVHSLKRDLADEMLGTQHMVEFADWLDDLDFGQAPVVNQVKLIFGKMRDLPWMPTQTREAGIAWCEDIEGMSEVRP